MTDPAPRRADATPGAPSDDDLRDAFRELHGRRLHGFALLLTLGDRQQSASLAAEAVAAGCDALDELRHPERAAAWLRRRVLDRTDDRGGKAAPAAIDVVGADLSVMRALARLGLMERAALIAGTVEGLDRRDVATIVGRDGAALDRLVQRARRRYLDAYAAAEREPATGGPIVAHIESVARAAVT